MSDVRVATDRDAAAELVAANGLPLDGLAESWLVLVTGEERVDGVVALERHGRPPVYLLRSVAVREDVRGTGIGRDLVAAALAAADADAGGRATVGLLTESAPGYFPRFGFHEVPRGGLPEPLGASQELQSACADTARAFLR